MLNSTSSRHGMGDTQSYIAYWRRGNGVSVPLQLQSHCNLTTVYYMISQADVRQWRREGFRRPGIDHFGALY